jgi:hypothetical protein
MRTGDACETWALSRSRPKDVKQLYHLVIYLFDGQTTDAIPAEK